MRTVSESSSEQGMSLSRPLVECRFLASFVHHLPSIAGIKEEREEQDQKDKAVEKPRYCVQATKGPTKTPLRTMLTQKFAPYWKVTVYAQIASLLICCTAIISSELYEGHNISISTTQSCLNYALLAIIYLPIWYCHINDKHAFWYAIKTRWWCYAILALVDVEANYLIVKAYSRTIMTTIQVIDVFVLPMAMLLSFFLLKYSYQVNHFVGVSACLLGCGLIVIADAIVKDDDSNKHRLEGDAMCLASSILYAVANVGAEMLLKKTAKLEYLSMIGIFGTIISSIQIAILEREELATVQLDKIVVWVLYIAFNITMFILYTLIPIIIETSSAAYLNVNLLTADFYSVIVGIFFKKYKVHGLYFVGFLCITLGTIIYCLKKTGIRNQANKNINESSSSKVQTVDVVDV